MRKKIRDYVISFLKEAIKEEIDTLGKSVFELSDRLYKLPVHTCWVCGNYMVKDDPMILYMGKYFHQEKCFDEYRRILEIDTSADHRFINGEIVRQFNGEVWKFPREIIDKEKKNEKTTSR